MKFVTMAKQAASRTAIERELKPKEYCGYDPRLEWTEEQFALWRDSNAGRQAFELETLATDNSGVADANGAKEDAATVDGDEDGVYAQMAVCDRKKCARHLEWGKLAVDDLRFEMTDNSDHMRAFDKEERAIKERAALRAKAGGVNGEGTVEVHGLGITNGDGGAGKEVDGQEKPAVVVETVEAAPPPSAHDDGQAEMVQEEMPQMEMPQPEAMVVDAAA